MKVSICTITARKGFLPEQMRMVASQTHQDLEWVVTDFSYEENVGQIKALAKELTLDVKYLPNVRDDNIYFRDISRNRNNCLANASGDYVIFIDDYAVINSDFVVNHLQFMERGFISAGLMYRLEDTQANSDFFDGLSNCFFSGLAKDLVEGNDDMGKDSRDRDGNPYKATGITYTGNLGFSRQVFESINGFDPRMAGSLEDCDFGARASIAGFQSIFNPSAYTVNLNTANFPYVRRFDHVHDVEPFISNPNNNFRGDAKLKANDFIDIEFCDGYRIATCKICGAKGMVDPNELINKNFLERSAVVPTGLPGGYDVLKYRAKKGGLQWL